MPDYKKEYDRTSLNIALYVAWPVRILWIWLGGGGLRVSWVFVIASILLGVIGAGIGVYHNVYAAVISLLLGTVLNWPLATNVKAEQQWEAFAAVLSPVLLGHAIAALVSNLVLSS